MFTSQLTQCSKAATSCIGLLHLCCSGHGSQSQTAHSGSVPHCPCNNSCLWPNATSASRLSAQEPDEYSTWGDIFPGAHYSDVRHEDKLRLMLMVPAQDYKQKLQGGVSMPISFTARVPPYTVVASKPQTECAASCLCSPNLSRETV